MHRPSSTREFPYESKPMMNEADAWTYTDQHATNRDCRIDSTDSPKYCSTERSRTRSPKRPYFDYNYRYKARERQQPHRPRYVHSHRDYRRHPRTRVWSEKFYENPIPQSRKNFNYRGQILHYYQNDVQNFEETQRYNQNDYQNDVQNFEETQRNQQLDETQSEEDAVYAKEWKIFWQRRFLELETERKNPFDHNYEPEWVVYWHKRKKELAEEKMKETNLELKRQYEFVDHHGSYNKELPPLSNSKQYESPQSVRILPSEDLKNSKFDTISSTSPSRMMLSSDLLQVLRMLAALEDCLGSIGPSITSLLSRALSTERYEMGSSVKLLEDDASSVDLLDTSKEKLKGLLSAGILNGVKATAATVAVENVVALLSHFHRPKQLPVGSRMNSSHAPPLVDLELLMENLRAAGFLLRSLPVVESTETGHQSHTFTALSPSSLQSSTDSVVSCSSQGRQSSDWLGKFSAEELKTLICNFRFLTSSQQRDLIDHLRRLENIYSDKIGTSQPTPPSTLTHSPLSKKYRQFDGAMNPIDPDLKIPRCPTILKITGLSSEDLELFGIPLHEIDKIDPPRQNVQFNEASQISEDIIPWTVPQKICNLSSNHYPHASKFCQHQSWPPHFSNVCPCGERNFESGSNNGKEIRQCSSTAVPINENYVSIQNSAQFFSSDELRRLSFCNEHLDPRRNRVQGECTSKFRNVFFDVQLRLSKKTQKPIVDPKPPIIIPTSPI